MAALAGVAVVAAGAAPPAADGPETASEGAVAPPPADTYPPALYDDGGAPPGQPAQEEQKRKIWRDPWLWIALLLALLLAGGAAAYFVTRSTKQVVVPNVINQPLRIAQTVLSNEGFKTTVTFTPNQAPSQTVIGEIPAGGARVDKGSNVALTVSSGPASVSVPPVVGDTVAQARRSLAKVGLKVGRVVSEPSGQIASGSVIDTSPSAGQPVPVGSTITVIVSSGPAKITVPDETGQPEGAARADLQKAGFRVAITTQQTSSTPAGNVVSQSPDGNTLAVPRSTVTLVIAQTPTTASVPGVTGDTASQAAGALQAAGFKFAQTTKTVTDKKKDGIVLSQDPTSGTSAMKGSTVTIVVGKASAGPSGPTGPARAR
jgi:serine/threonine-protein kinase